MNIQKSLTYLMKRSWKSSNTQEEILLDKRFRLFPTNIRLNNRQLEIGQLKPQRILNHPNKSTAYETQTIQEPVYDDIEIYI
ncbi:hypothetical protein pb186bvf_016119 [Paramecium bursaria]